MRHTLYYIQRMAVLLVLLAAGWAAGGALSARTVAELPTYTAADQESKHRLSSRCTNVNALRRTSFYTSSGYGEWKGNGETDIAEGEEVTLSFYTNSNYSISKVTVNGQAQDMSYQSVSFVMPAEDVEVVVYAEFNPASPSDPQAPAEPVDKYTLTLASNPAGAVSLSGSGSYAAGQSVYVSASVRSGYRFVGWTRDGETVSTRSSFSYDMPASDAVLTACCVYNPASPGDPEQPALKHPLTAVASPAGAATFSLSASEVTFGESYYVYARPRTGYKLKGWLVNGKAVDETSTTLTGTMTDAGAQVVALLVYSPASPANPGANYYNPSTGQVIIDDFVQGGLYNALSSTVGSGSYDDVSSLIVKGRMSAADYGAVAALKGAAIIDLSRTGGESRLPDYAFRGMAASSIMLPENIASLGYCVFGSCDNLTALTVYAKEPPVCSNTFYGFNGKDALTVYVPAESVELYAAADCWKDFNIHPITDDAHTLQVNLPADAADGRYRNNYIELVNVNTGVRQKYVVSARLLYTFGGLKKGEQYNVYMTSKTGLEIGRMEGIVIPDRDSAVTFGSLKGLRSVAAKVLAPDGTDVTQHAVVEWLKPQADGTLAYMRKAVSLGEVPDGQRLVCRVTLDETLGMEYVAPADTEFDVDGQHGECSIVLVPFATVTLSGCVTDSEGAPISGASVSATQTLNGMFDKTITAKTDRHGLWTLAVANVPGTRLAFAATECVEQSDSIKSFAEGATEYAVGTVAMKSVVGARITYALNYRAAGDGEAQRSYSDYQNVALSVYNLTQNRAHGNVAVRYPVLSILDENIAEGDELRITATSKTGAFSPIETVAVVGANRRAETTFCIMGRGGIKASFEMTDNPAVSAMLYSSAGELLAKQAYSEATVTFDELADGDYTLVSMGQSDLMNTILRLSSLGEIGLVEGKDYVKNVVSVESGKIAEVKNGEIPAFDEGVFRYTTDAARFYSNRSSITSGGYLTLSALVDFKGVYKSGVSDVRLVVDMPEACELVEKSVIQGPKLIDYTLDGKRLTIKLGDNYQGLTRFCVVPTRSGAFNVSASVAFDCNGHSVMQPIGTASAEVKDIEISVPSVIASAKFWVTGVAKANSDIRVYDNGTLLGSAKANGAGLWNAECELADAYNLSVHSVYAEINTPQGMSLVSETKNVTYDKNAIRVSKVTMYHFNPEMHKTYESVFDFINPKTTPTQWTIYYPNKKFTYTIEFTSNDPERVSNVVLYVHTAGGKCVPCPAKFDSAKKLWYAELDMGKSNDNYYPVNCSVDFDAYTEKLTDTGQLAQASVNYSDAAGVFADDVKRFDAMAGQGETAVDEAIDDVDNVDTPDWTVSLDGMIDGVTGMEAAADDKATLQYFNAMSDDELDSYIAGIADIDYAGETDRLQTAMDIIAGNMSADMTGGTTLADGTKITLATCDGLTVDDLLERGFQYCPTTGGGGMYVLTDENRSELADFDNNRYTTIVYGSSLKAVAKAVMRKASGLETGLDKFNEVMENINGLLSPITEAWNNTNKELFDFVEFFKNEYTRISSDFGRKKANYNSMLAKLGRLKKELKGMNSLSLEYHLKLGEIQDYQKKVKAAKGIMNSAGRLKALSGIAYKAIKPLPGIFAKQLPMAKYIDAVYTYLGVARKFQKVYLTIPDPCKDDQERADNARTLCVLGATYIEGVATAKLGATALLDLATFSLIASSAGTAGVSVIGAACTLVANILVNIGIDHLFDKEVNKRLGQITLARNTLECVKKCGTNGYPACPDDYEDDKPNGGDNKSGAVSDNVKIDPSGYVYEAVPDNRVEGVQASIYYKEYTEDMWGDKHENVVLWNAEDYAQKNPLFTDENGMYRWDVPQGLWQVKFEKDGYATAYSEWLPVPPPQLEVNIGIRQDKQPEVVEARAYEEGVEVQFDKHMLPATLTADNIMVTAGGQKLAGDISLLDLALADEQADSGDASATRYASRVRFVPQQPLGMTTGEIRLTVSRNVQSYAGIHMAETYSQTLDVEKEVQAISADNIKVLYGGSRQLVIYATPSEAAAGRTLRIANSSALVASVDIAEATLDAEGKAVVNVAGELPGRTLLSYAIDGVSVVGQSVVDVQTEIVTAETPKASRASGTAVYRGTKIELSTDSKNATIYFTTDGSCPCDENGTRRKYTVPFVVEGDLHIKAMTEVDDEVSATVEFNYTLKRSDIDFRMEKGWTWMSHNLDDAVSPADIAQDAGVSRIVSQTQELTRDPQLGMVGTLAAMPASSSYKVLATADVALPRMSGVAWNPATPIALTAGWNWLGYPVSQTMTVDEALAATAAETLDVIVGQDGFAQFDGEKWVGTLAKLTPGAGYMYQSVSAKTVVYNTSIVSMASALHAQGISDGLSCVPDIHKYASVMPLVAVLVDADGAALDNARYRVAAFCGSECRGIGSVVNGLVMMNVYGDAGDRISFGISSADGDDTCAAESVLTFGERVVGDVFTPYQLVVGQPTGVGAAGAANGIKVSAKGGCIVVNGTAISTVEVFDASGKKVACVAEVPESGVTLPAMPGGVYVVAVNAGGEYSYHKVAVR